MAKLLEFLNNMWHTTQEMAAWLLVGCAVAGIMHVFLPENFVRRHLGRAGWKNIVKATILGVPLPLCSCGVIPATLGLKKDGASDAASVGFLVSTPQTGVDSIAVSAAFLGLPFALFKVFSAFVTGIVAGGLVQLTDRNPPSEHHEPENGGRPPKGFLGKVAEGTHFALDELLAGFAIWVAIGIAVSALISTFVAPGALADSPLATGVSGILIMLLASLPLYVCATGSVPVAAALVSAGMPTGAALVFLMAGPATNAATLGAVLKFFGRRVTFIYVSVIAVGSVLLGILYQQIWGDLHAADSGLHEMHSWPHRIAALFLIAFMGHLVVRRVFKRKSSPACCGGCCHENK